MSTGPAPAALPGTRWGSSSAPRQECAYVFLLFGQSCEHYLLGIFTVAWSLTRHFCVHRRVLMHTPDVPRNLLDLAVSSGLFCEVVPTDYVEASEVFFSNPQAHARFGKIFTKYRVLKLDRYEKILFLDADLHVRANLDYLFDLEPPAAMARGPHKPPEGEKLEPGMPINAGVMLLRPDTAQLDRMLQDITGPTPHRPANYNSPDADYLTEHAFRGQWTSLPLRCNYQLEFERLDPRQGTIRFSQAREAHFSEEGAALPWQSLEVLHFSGAKPWAHILDGAAALQDLKVIGGAQPALGEKLAAGVREYAREVASLQGLCSQLQIGEGSLWREARWERTFLPLTPERARARLNQALPAGGRWFEGQRPRTAVWIPPGEGLPLPNASFDRSAPVGAYLEIGDAESGASVCAGDTVSVLVRGARREFEVVSVCNGTAAVRRNITLPQDWQVATDPDSDSPYYHNLRTGEVQWEFPDLPAYWQPVTDPETKIPYYHDTRTNVTCWDPPEVEELEKPLEDLEIDGGRADRGERSDVAIWKRSFIEDLGVLSQMKGALEAVARSA